MEPMPRESRGRALLSFLSRHNFLAIEFLVFIKFCGLATCTIAYSMLLQDKICMQHYHQNVTYCQHLGAQNETSPEIRDHILSETSKFSTYRNLIEFVPMFVWSLFVGSFLDRYISGTRTLLILSLLGDLFTYLCVLFNIYHFYDWSPYVLLVSCIQVFFTGGMVSFLTTIFRYMALSVDQASRPIKFALFEASVILGFSLGNILGGRILLKLKDVDADHPRTYGRNYLVAILLFFISFGLVFCLKKVQTPSPKKPNVDSMNNVEDEEEQENTNPRDRLASLTGSVNPLVDDEGKSSSRTPVSRLNDEIDHIRQEGRAIVKSFFSWSNVSQTLSSITRPRPNHARVTILVLFFLQFIQVLVFMGQNAVFLQFTERVYHWTPRMFSTFSAVSKIASISFLTIWVVVFVKKFQVDQRKLIILGLLSASLSQTLLGTFETPITYMLIIPIESFGGLISIAVRSMISSIVEKNEIGKIFSLMTTLETGLPLLATLIYTSLFSASISHLPGLIYYFSAFLFLLAFLAYMAEEFYTMKSVEAPKEEEEEEEEEEQQAHNSNEQIN